MINGDILIAAQIWQIPYYYKNFKKQSTANQTTVWYMVQILDIVYIATKPAEKFEIVR